MTLELFDDLWSELKTFVQHTDRDDCAESLVSLLIDSDFEAQDIFNQLGHDIHIKRALSSYLETNDDQEDEEDDEDDEYSYDH